MSHSVTDTTVTTDVTAVLLAGAEGPLTGISVRSLLEAAAAATDAGIRVELLAILDRSDDATRLMLTDAGAHGIRVEEIDAGDAGAARNRAVELAAGSHVAFLDAGDLWSANWLVEAHRVAATGEKIVVHPEVSWVFDVHAEIFFSADQADPAFSGRLLDVENPWDPTSVAPVAMHRAHPAGIRRTPEQGERDDWRLHRATHADGWVHRVAPETVHFRRVTAREAYGDVPDHSLSRSGAFLQSGWAPGA